MVTRRSFVDDGDKWAKAAENRWLCVVAIEALCEKENDKKGVRMVVGGLSLPSRQRLRVGFLFGMVATFDAPPPF